MGEYVALGNVAENLIAVQLADEGQFRPCGNVSQNERKAYLLQHAVRHGIVGFRLADDSLQVESLVEIERGQAKELRAIAFTPQISAPHMQMYAAKFARHDVLERGMSNGFAIDTPCEYEASKPIDWRSDHCLQVGTQLGGQRHSIDRKTHTLGVGFGYPRKISDEAVKIFAGQRSNSQVRHATNR